MDTPGTRAPTFTNAEIYLTRTRQGNLWLIADNAIEGASASTTSLIGPFWKTVYTVQNPGGSTGNPVPTPSPWIDAPSCAQVNNVIH